MNLVDTRTCTTIYLKSYEFPLLKPTDQLTKPALTLEELLAVCNKMRACIISTNTDNSGVIYYELIAYKRLQ